MRLSIIHDRDAMQEESDHALIAALKAGENRAFDALMRRYKRRLHAFIVRYVRDEETAYDILQETFTKVYFNIGSFDESRRFTTWMFTIAINLCRDHKRRARLRATVPREDGWLEQVADHAPSGEQTAITRQQLARIAEAIDLLPHKLKTALILFAVEEHSQEECAAILGTTPKTVETRVYRARKLLNKKLKIF